LLKENYRHEQSYQIFATSQLGHDRHLYATDGNLANG
jgi:hypothetical protein